MNELLQLMLHRRSVRKYTGEAILSIGVPEERPKGYTVEDLKEEKIHWEKF